MIIQGGNSYLNKQNSRSQKSSDSSSFEDILTSSNNKKKDTLDTKSVTVSKKKDDKDKVVSSEQNSNIPNKPIVKDDKTNKSEKNGEIKTQSTKQGQDGIVKSEQFVAQEKVEANGSKENESLLSQKLQESLGDIETLDIKNSEAFKGSNVKNNLNQNAEVEESLLSLNLSAVDNKTLAKNENIISDFENQVARLIQEQNQLAKPEVSQASLVNPQIAQTIKSQDGLLKLDNALKEASSDSTLDNLSDQLKALTIESGDKDPQLKDDKADLNSLFSQHLDQESMVNGNEPNQFADELGLLSGEGKAEKIENMQSIIKDAKAIIDDGGGSMEIHLQPEGLGKVHLKVAVQNGQVSVEMLADNVAAKRALEDGLFDIKQALEGHKLLVETLKVEMSPDYQKDFTDMRDHMSEQANRDFAEQFLGQFKQEREDRMGGFFEGFKNFQRNPEEPNLLLNQRNPYTQNGKGRTLNVVA